MLVGAAGEVAALVVEHEPEVGHGTQHRAQLVLRFAQLLLLAREGEFGLLAVADVEGQMHHAAVAEPPVAHDHPVAFPAHLVLLAARRGERKAPAHEIVAALGGGVVARVGHALDDLGPARVAVHVGGQVAPPHRVGDDDAALRVGDHHAGGEAVDGLAQQALGGLRGALGFDALGDVAGGASVAAECAGFVEHRRAADAHDDAAIRRGPVGQHVAEGGLPRARVLVPLPGTGGVALDRLVDLLQRAADHEVGWHAGVGLHARRHPAHAALVIALPEPVGAGEARLAHALGMVAPEAFLQPRIEQRAGQRGGFAQRGQGVVVDGAGRACDAENAHRMLLRDHPARGPAVAGDVDALLQRGVVEREGQGQLGCEQRELRFGEADMGLEVRALVLIEHGEPDNAAGKLARKQAHQDVEFFFGRATELAHRAQRALTAGLDGGGGHDRGERCSTRRQSDVNERRTGPQHADDFSGEGRIREPGIACTSAQ